MADAPQYCLQGMRFTVNIYAATSGNTIFLPPPPPMSPSPPPPVPASPPPPILTSPPMSPLPQPAPPPSLNPPSLTPISVPVPSPAPQELCPSAGPSTSSPPGHLSVIIGSVAGIFVLFLLLGVGSYWYQMAIFVKLRLFTISI